MEKGSQKILLSTSAAKHHGVWSLQSGRSEASDVISHSNLATSLKENTCNCHVCTSGDRGKRYLLPLTQQPLTSLQNCPLGVSITLYPFPSRCIVLSILFFFPSITVFFLLFFCFLCFLHSKLKICWTLLPSHSYFRVQSNGRGRRVTSKFRVSSNAETLQE